MAFESASKTTQMVEHSNIQHNDQSIRSGSRLSFKNNTFYDTEKAKVASEREIELKESPHPSLKQSDTQIQEVESTNIEEDGIQYPGPVKVFFITLALCLAVFLVALVRGFTHYSAVYTNQMKDQTIIATVRIKIDYLCSKNLIPTGCTKDNG